MSQDFNILVSGRLDKDVQAIAVALRSLEGVAVTTHILLPGQDDPMAGVNPAPDMLVLFLADEAERHLQSIMQRPSRLRPILLVIGGMGGDSPAVMRLAMQAGARDFLHYPLEPPEVVSMVKKIVRESNVDLHEQSTLTAFISPKGGGGASTVAEGVAHVLRVQYGCSTLLMDLDCQFGTQYLNLDLRPDKGLKEALDVIDSLDDVALKGYVGQHSSGLHVLGTLPTQIILPGEITEKRLYRLMELLMANYSQIVVDLPCTIDSTFSLIVEKMRHIVMVVQQDFQNVRNAQKLNQILRDELQVPPSRIAVIINRYEVNNAITIQDVEQALQLKVSGVLPSDYRSVNDAANLGVPLMAHAPKSLVTQSIIALSAWVVGQPPPPPEKKLGVFGQLRAALSGRK